MISVKVYGAKELSTFLRDLPDKVKKPASEAAAEVIRAAASGDTPSPRIYPSRPNPSRYVRTFNLKRGWTAKPRGAYTSVTNSVPYAGYVMGGLNSRPRQAWMHTPYWWTVDDVLANFAGKAMIAARDAVEWYMEKNAPKPGPVTAMPGDEVGV